MKITLKNTSYLFLSKDNNATPHFAHHTLQLNG
jgi:hypothetical protein